MKPLSRGAVCIHGLERMHTYYSGNSGVIYPVHIFPRSNITLTEAYHMQRLSYCVSVNVTFLIILCQIQLSQLMLINYTFYLFSYITSFNFALTDLQGPVSDAATNYAHSSAQTHQAT